MAWNFKRELARKFVHFLSVFILFIYFIVSDAFSSRIALFLLVLILIIFLEFEYLRIEIGKQIPILNNIWSYLRRKKEKETIGGDIFFLIGAILVLAIFETRIAMAAILMTTFGDLSAALVGKRFGKHIARENKNWEGVVAEFVVDILIGIFVFIIFSAGSITDVSIWLLILLMALTATIVETMVSKMDDNLLIPIFAGFNGQMLSLIMRYFG